MPKDLLHVVADHDAESSNWAGTEDTMSAALSDVTDDAENLVHDFLKKISEGIDIEDIIKDGKLNSQEEMVQLKKLDAILDSADLMMNKAAVSIRNTKLKLPNRTDEAGLEANEMFACNILESNTRKFKDGVIDYEEMREYIQSETARYMTVELQMRGVNLKDSDINMITKHKNPVKCLYELMPTGVDHLQVEDVTKKYEKMCYVEKRMINVQKIFALIETIVCEETRLDDIENNMGKIKETVYRANKNIVKAEWYHDESWKLWCWRQKMKVGLIGGAIIICTIIVFIILGQTGVLNGAAATARKNRRVLEDVLQTKDDNILTVEMKEDDYIAVGEDEDATVFYE